MLTLLTFNVICVSLCIVVSNTYGVAYLFFMSSSSCVTYAASFSVLSISIGPSVFSNIA
jgi:hypothetical protein